MVAGVNRSNRSGGNGPVVRGLPNYTRRLLGFQAFNSVNFTIAIGTPMVLLAKFLGAGETMIGLLIALTPFFNVIFIMLASHRAAGGCRLYVQTS